MNTRVPLPEPVDPADKNRLRAEHYAKTVPQPADNDPTDPRSMTRPALLASILAAFNKDLDRISDDELRDAVSSIQARQKAIAEAEAAGHDIGSADIFFSPHPRYALGATDGAGDDEHEVFGSRFNISVPLDDDGQWPLEQLLETVLGAYEDDPRPEAAEFAERVHAALHPALPEEPPTEEASQESGQEGGDAGAGEGGEENPPSDAGGGPEQADGGNSERSDEAAGQTDGEPPPAAPDVDLPPAGDGPAAEGEEDKPAAGKRRVTPKSKE